MLSALTIAAQADAALGLPHGSGMPDQERVRRDEVKAVGVVQVPRRAAGQARILALLGGSLTAQAATLLADEAVDGRVELPQRTLAAMLGVARPSLNKVLKDLERDGLIRISYGTIEVLVRARLAART